MLRCFNYKKLKDKTTREEKKVIKNKFKLSFLLYSVYLRNRFVKSYIK